MIEKQVDVLVGTTTINSTASITLINLINPGESYYQRVGNRVVMTEVELMGRFTLTGTATTLPDYARILVVYDNANNGASGSSIANILLDQNAVGTTGTNALSGYNFNYRDRFDIISDQYWYLPTSTGIPSSETNYVIRMRKDLCHDIMFDGSSGTQTDIQRGALLLITIGTQTAGTEGWQASVKSRIKYDD